MELLLDRKYKKSDYTIGKLYVDGEYFCDTLEDADRGLTQETSVAVIRATKRRYPDQTAIPRGVYRVTLGVQSPRFSKSKSYDWCNGYLPRLINVTGYEGVLIHSGNTAAHSAGCVLVGENKQKGKVLNSMTTLRRLYDRLKSANSNIYITIK